MINIQILDRTIDPAGLRRQVALQVDNIKNMIAEVSDTDDQYRQLFIAIRMVPQFKRTLGGHQTVDIFLTVHRTGPVT